jgi:23S rRNA pseudouridine1911/1915/1917 synthase
MGIAADQSQGMNQDSLPRTAVLSWDPSGQRTDQVISSLFPDVNRSQVQKAMNEGKIAVNGAPIDKKHRLKAGDVVAIRILDQKQPSPPHAVPIELEVLYEDAHVIMVNKAPGMVTHPGNGTGDDTLTHALLAHCDGKLSTINGEDRPGIVHRLDKDTSGILIAAKTDEACARLLEKFRTHDLVKEYLTLVCGRPTATSGTIKARIARHPTHRTRMAIAEEGREAHTDWARLSDDPSINLMRCRIHTGRTHQIRVHMKHLGHPIIGDKLYGYRPTRHPGIALQSERPLLHAWHLALQHPITGKRLERYCPVPSDFEPWLAQRAITLPTK